LLPHLEAPVHKPCLRKGAAGYPPDRFPPLVPLRVADVTTVEWLAHFFFSHEDRPFSFLFPTTFEPPGLDSKVSVFFPRVLFDFPPGFILLFFDLLILPVFPLTYLRQFFSFVATSPSVTRFHTDVCIWFARRFFFLCISFFSTLQRWTCEILIPYFFRFL